MTSRRHQIYARRPFFAPGNIAQTGALRWQTLINGNYTLFAQENGALFAQSVDTIAAIRESDGHILWTYSFVNSQSNMSFVERDGIIAYFFLGPNPSVLQPQVVAVDAATGQQKWSVLFQNPQAFAPNPQGLAVGDGAVYIYDLDGYVKALAGADGHQLWSAMPGSSQQLGLLSYDAGTVFAATYGDALIAYDAQTGTKKWSLPVEGLPTVASGIGYGAGSDQRVYAVNVATGVLLWKQDYGEQYEGQPVVSDGWVYAYVSNGFIQAYDSNTGRIVWGYNAGYGFLGIEP